MHSLSRRLFLAFKRRCLPHRNAAPHVARPVRLGVERLDDRILPTVADSVVPPPPVPETWVQHLTDWDKYDSLSLVNDSVVAFRQKMIAAPLDEFIKSGGMQGFERAVAQSLKSGMSALSKGFGVGIDYLSFQSKIQTQLLRQGVPADRAAAIAERYADFHTVASFGIDLVTAVGAGPVGGVVRSMVSGKLYDTFAFPYLNDRFAHADFGVSMGELTAALVNAGGRGGAAQLPGGTASPLSDLPVVLVNLPPRVTADPIRWPAADPSSAGEFILFESGTGPNGARWDVRFNADGTVSLTREVRDGNGTLVGVERETRSVGRDGQVSDEVRIGEYCRTDPNGGLIGEPESVVNWGEVVADLKKVGALFGSAVGRLIGGSKPLGQVVGGTVGATLAESVLGSLAEAGGSLLSGTAGLGVLGASPFADGLRKTVGQLGGAFVGHLQTEAASFLGSLITAEVAGRLPVGGLVGELLTAAGQTVTADAIGQVFDAAFRGEALTKLALIDKASLGSTLGGALGAKLAAKLIDIDSLGEGVLASVVGQFGAWKGAMIGSVVAGGTAASGTMAATLLSAGVGKVFSTAVSNLLLPGIGALLGMVGGQVIGSKVYELADWISGGGLTALLEKDPWHYQHVRFDPATNRLVVWREESDETTADLRRGTQSLTDGYFELVHRVFDQIGGRVDPTLLNEQNGAAYFGFHHKKNPYGDGDYKVVIGGGPSYVSAAGNSARIVRIGAEYTLARTRFVGGDPAKLRAFEAWKLSLDDPGRVPGDSILSLLADLQLADDVNLYEQNRREINLLMAAAPSSSFTLGWMATLARWQGLNDAATGRLIAEARGRMAAGDTPAGLWLYNRAVQFAPEDPALFAELGRAYAAAGRTDPAVYQWQRAVGFAPGDADTWSVLGHTLLVRGERAAGVYALNRALGIRPDRRDFLALGYAQFDGEDAVAGRYSLQRAHDLGEVIDPARLPRGGVAEAAAYIASAQLANGALALSRDPAGYDPARGNAPYFKVDPYFALLSATRLPARVGDTDTARIAREYLRWHLDHLDPTDGTAAVHYYYRDGTVARATTRADADDSPAALLFSALRTQYEATGDRSLLDAVGVRGKLEQVAELLLRLQEPNGLTRTFLDRTQWQALYLMDAAESFAGFRDAAYLFGVVYGDAGRAADMAAAAERVRTGILTHLFDPATGLFHVGLLLDRASGQYEQLVKADLNTWYPGTSPLVWPILFGVVPPDSAVARGQLAAINARWNGVTQPLWTTRTDSGAVALVARLLGDRTAVEAATATITRGPYPTFAPTPVRTGFDDAVTTIADAVIVLWLLEG